LSPIISVGSYLNPDNVRLGLNSLQNTVRSLFEIPYKGGLLTKNLDMTDLDKIVFKID